MEVVKEGVPVVARPQEARVRYWLLALLTVVPWAILRAGALAESDTFWEIRTGLLTITQRAIPTTDPFSWTVHGEPWTLNSWGFNVVIAFAYRIFGLPGAALFGAGLAVVIAGLVLILARSLGAEPLGSAIVLLLALPFLTAFLSARPQLVDYLGTLLIVMVLRSLVKGGRRKPPLVAAAGMIGLAWVNLHAGALLGVAIAGLCTALVLIPRETRSVGRWCAAVTAAVFAGALVNPVGVGLFAQTARVKSASLGVVVEWGHLDLTSPLQVTMLIAGLVALAIALRRRDPVFVAALVVATAGAVTALRILPVLVLLSIPVLASAGPFTRYARSRWHILLVGVVCLVGVIAVVAAPSLRHLGRPDPATYPRGVVQAISRGCHVYNDYLQGGYILLERPDVAVSLDSRNDIYGGARIAQSQRVLRGEGEVDSALTGAGCVLARAGSGLATRLAREPAWTLRSSSATQVLFVRR